MKLLPLLAVALSLPITASQLRGDSSGGDFVRSLETAYHGTSYATNTYNAHGSCEICSSEYKHQPDILIFQYIPNGIDSKYQDATQATCVGGTYPWSTRLTVVNLSGVRQTFDLTGGDSFTITGPFGAETAFEYDNGSCSIHTSCSVPLVNGDQLGPFMLKAGNNCYSPDIPECAKPIDNTPEGTCEICSKENKDKPDFLTIEYNPNGVNSQYQDSSKASCRAGTYPSMTNLVVKNKNKQTQTFGNVVAGDVFTIRGPFNAETTFEYQGGECFIHTSCSVALVTNDQIGPFKVLAGNECNGAPGTSTVPPQEIGGGACEICSKENKDRPNSLSLQYTPQGANSAFQDSGKASCRAGTYPTTTRLTMENKNGIRQTFDVTAGDNITIAGPFSAETTFEYDNGDCFIHTSCSVPLVVDDQIGPFLVIAGNECGIPPESVAPPTDNTPEGMCEICSRDNKDKPEFLTIQYFPFGLNSQYQDSSKASCRAGTYPDTTNIIVTNKNGFRQTFANVKTGNVFTIRGPFDAETTFQYQGGDCFIHTSCSAPLVTNDQIGPFKMLAGNECNSDPSDPNPETPPPEEQFCEICSKENKNKPDSLTLEYIPQGVNSMYQEEKKASCRAGSYPTTTRLIMTSKSGVRQTFDVTAGDKFTIVGPFSAETTFEYDGGDCFIHTSCSVPLVTNDQIGPFRVVAGNECGTPTPTVPVDPGGTCEICSPDNKDKPEFLTIQYNPIGKDSQYQDSSKASCGAGMYPSVTFLTTENKDGHKQTFTNVQAGDIFTIQGNFESKTVFEYSGGDCFIHTSCSAPLVTNDQIGPFVILAGNECIQDPPTPAPTPSPTPVPGSPTVGPTVPPPGTPTLPPTFTPPPATPRPTPSPPLPTPTPGTPTLSPSASPPVPPPTPLPTPLPGSPTLSPTTPGGVGPTPPPFEQIVTLPPFDGIETLPPQPTVPPGSPSNPPTPPPATPRPIDPSNELPCEICSKNNGETPEMLVLVYKSEGKDSQFQSDKESTCGMGNYPESTTIVFTNKDGVQAFQVNNGDSFTIVGPFEDKTNLSLSGTSTTCTITLSCKVPLYAGDQLGPFLITEGNDCKFETQPPTSSPSSSPSQAPTTRSPTRAPSPAPSGTPSAAPSPSPSEAPSTSEPTISPSSAPSPSPSAAPSPAPSETPSESFNPTRAPCISVNKEVFVITEEVEVTYNVNIDLSNPLTNQGHICIYPCAVTDYFNSYHWGCGSTPGNCVPANSSGQMDFSTGGDACRLDDQRWPVAPTYNADGSVNTCYKG